MAKARITKQAVDSARAGEKDQLLWDDRLSGFGLKVTPKGSKIFVYQYRLGGRGSPVRRYTIGRYGALTPDQARRHAETLALQATQGIDPQREKVKSARIAVDLAFKPYVERFAEGCLRVDWPASHKYAQSLLVAHAVPILGTQSLSDIKRRDVLGVLATVKDKAATATNLYRVMRRMFRWAVEQEDIARSPIEGMRPPTPPSSRARVLEDRELASVWRAADTMGYPFGPLTHLLISTGARRDEVASLDWSELDREKRIWSLPTARSKNGVAARQPLSDLAVACLDGLAERIGKGGQAAWPAKGFVLSTTGRTPISGYSKAKARLDVLAELQEPWRLHDLRRTLATGLQRLGVRFEVTEAVLNHVSGSKGGIAGIYQRHDWADEKRNAVQAWADHVASLLASADHAKPLSLTGAQR